MEHNDNQSKAETLGQIFCERVTVAGLEDLYTAKFPSTRYMFAVGMVLSTIFGLFTSFRTIQQTLHETPSVNIRFKDDGDMLYPNLTICTTAVTNVTAIRKLMTVPKEVEKKLKEVGADRKQFMEDIILLASLSLASRQINQSLLRYMGAVFTAAAATFSHGETNLFELIRPTMPPCNLTLSNCKYDGNPIDCCNGIVPGLNNGYVCYGLPLSTIPRERKPFSRPIVFNADVRMDWAHIPWVRGEDALDGFLVIVSEPFTSMNTAPVAVAPGWHGTIKLTRIRRRTDRTDCITKEKLPKLNYASYYDQDGKNCEMEIILDVMRNGLQCTSAMATYFPNRTEGCSFQQTYVARQGVTGALENVDMAALKNYKDITVQLRNKLGSLTQRCKPICQRWQYEPIVGYSELRDSHGRTTDANSNISWSRITVSIPSEYYEEHMEEGSDVYTTICNVGGAMGVCLGLSAVTVVQMVWFGLHCCYMYKRNRKRIHSS